MLISRTGPFSVTQKLIAALLSATLLALLFAGAQASRPLRTLDEVTLDLQFLLRGSRSTRWHTPGSRAEKGTIPPTSSVESR